MDKRIASLLGAAAALGAVTAAQAAVPPTDQLAPAASYGDLLQPIANPLPLLKADNARPAETPTMQLADKTVVIKKKRNHHHHHHHHHHDHD